MLPPPTGTAVVTLLAVTEVTVSVVPGSPSVSLLSTLPVAVPASFNVAESAPATGRSGTEFTVIVNVCDGELAEDGVPLSTAVTVIVAVPNALGAGVYVKVPFVPMAG